MKMLLRLGMLAGAAILCSAPVSLHRLPAGPVTLSLDSAQARVGRPLTPLSAAGVHRRARRRAYYGAAGTYGPGAYYHGEQPACGYYPYPPCY